MLSAFKAVEIAVRKAGAYEAGELGVKLMRKAFSPARALFLTRPLRPENSKLSLICSPALSAQPKIQLATGL